MRKLSPSILVGHAKVSSDSPRNDANDIKPAGQAGHQLARKRQRPEVEPALVSLHRELHRIVRLRRNPAGSCHDFQSRAIEIISRRERRIQQHRRVIALHKRRLAALTGVRLSKEEATDAKRRIVRSRVGIEHALWVIDIARSLCDGLAFALLPKWDIKPLSMKEPAGFISGKRGFPLERRVARTIAKRERVPAILNDLTHCLRYGDVTVPGNPPRVFEVKSGSRRSDRDRRQHARASEVLEYLQKDVAPNWQGTGQTLRRIELTVKEQHHRRLVPALIREAISNGSSTRWPEPGLCYLALGAEGLDSALRPLLKRLGNAPLCVPLFRGMLPRYWLPLSLSLTDSEAWWSVTTGVVSVVVLFDIDRIVQLFSARGVEAEWDGADPMLGSGWTLRSLDGAAGPMKVSGDFFGRVAGELLSVRWFVEETVVRLERGPLPTEA